MWHGFDLERVRRDSLYSMDVNQALVWAYGGLFLIVLVEALAICILYYRNTTLLQLVKQGQGANSLIGSLSPQFSALEVRTGKVLTSNEIISDQTYLLFINSNCFVCQKLLDDLHEHREILEELEKFNLVIYCQGSHRGCARSLKTLDSRIVILVEQDKDIAELFSIKTPPVLVEINSHGRIVNQSYPFSTTDLMTSHQVSVTAE